MDDDLHEIDLILMADRPDRYERTDTSWMDNAIDARRQQLSADEARTRAAVADVKGREKTHVRNGNRVLRHYSGDGIRPMDWMEQGRLPITIGNWRVCLEDCTADDFRQFDHDERPRAESDYEARIAACDGALGLAELIEEWGASTLGDVWGCADARFPA